jgi:hypothetical protein
MNPARRAIRNTMLALYGLAIAYVGVNRLHAAVVDADTPSWLRTTLSLGLDGFSADTPAPAPEEAADQLFRDLTRLNVSETADSPTFFDWNARAAIGWAAAIGTSTNVVKVTRSTRWRSTGTTRLLHYMTGGHAGVVDANALASARQGRPPNRQVATHQEGDVLVRYWDEGPDAGDAGEFVLRAAQAIHLVTTRIWPRKPTPVRVDVYVMPQETAYSLARKVQWKSGHPLELAILVPGAIRAESHQFVAAHELYHVLAALLRTGPWATGAMGRGNVLGGLEEVAATLFASCGALLADGHVVRPKASTFLIDGVRLQQPLSGDNVRQLLAWMRDADARQRAMGPYLGNVLQTTPVFHILGSVGERIELHSPQGEQLLGMCREFLSDPARIESWLENFSQ